MRRVFCLSGYEEEIEVFFIFEPEADRANIRNRNGNSFAGVAQLAEHVLGKDGVTGSIPVSSSIFEAGQLEAKMVGPQLMERGKLLGPN